MGLRLEIHAIRPGDALDADEYMHALEVLKRVKALLDQVLLARCVLVEDKRRDNHVGRPKKNKAAVELGHRGGTTRDANMTPEQRLEVARRVARARWSGKGS